MKHFIIFLFSALLMNAPVLAESNNKLTTGEKLPFPDPVFKGVIKKTAKESTPDFPKAVTPPKNAPNILLIITDDVGYGASSPFGGLISTPTFQKEANRGIRYTNFHTTALCSPTRAALIVLVK